MTIVTCQLSGGLGNQLNQVSGALIRASELGAKVVFDSNNYNRLTQGNLENRYKQTIFRNLIWEDLSVSDSCGMEFLTAFFYPTNLLDLHHKDLIRKFKPPSELVRDLSKKYARVLGYPNCAIHVRRGDLAQFPGLYKILPPDYYQQAINRFDRDTKFLIFSDDMEYCRRIFTGDRFFFSEEIEDDIDLYLMSLCQNQIIANSTFSWWGAFLNTNPDKIVIHPQI